MQIQHVLFAERAAIVNDRVMVDGLLPNFVVLNHSPEPGRPTLFGFAVIISVLNPEEHFQLSVTIQDPEGNVVAKAQGSVDANKEAPNVRENVDGLVSAALIVDFHNFPFPSLGKYTVTVQAGDETIVRVLTVTLVK